MTLLSKTIAAALVATAVTLPLQTQAADHGGMKKDMMHSGVMVSGVWARATAPTAKNGAAYMTLTSHGGADELVKVTGDVAGRIEMHTHQNDGGVMKMRQVQSIAVEDGSPTVLQPGGLHIMLIGLKAPLKEGATFPLGLTFKSGKTQSVTVKVTGIRGKTMDHSGHDMKGHKH